MGERECGRVLRGLRLEDSVQVCTTGGKMEDK